MSEEEIRQVLQEGENNIDGFIDTLGNMAYYELVNVLQKLLEMAVTLVANCPVDTDGYQRLMNGYKRVQSAVSIEIEHRRARGEIPKRYRPEYFV